MARVLTALVNGFQIQAMKNYKSLSVLFVVLTLTFCLGCVSKSKYDDVAGALAQEQATVKTQLDKIAELELMIIELEKKLGTASDDKESLRTSVQNMKQALAEMTARKQEAESRIKEYRDLIRRFQKLTEAGRLSVKIVDGRMVVGLPSDVLFPSGSAQLSAGGRNTIKEVTRVLVDIPEKKYQVEGHTDNVPIRTSQFPSNWELASARGVNVAKMMVDAGMPSSRVSAAAFGEFKPIVSNSNAEGKAANRRIEIVIVPDLSTLPGYEELKSLSAPGETKEQK